MNAYEKAQNQIEEAKRLLSDAQAQLDALQRSAAVEAPKSWEPKGGDWFINNAGDVFPGILTEPARRAGTEYPTREAADSAAPYVTFFKRLCCLAAELNPSGKVGGRYRIVTDDEGSTWRRNAAGVINRDPWDLFETSDAAERAAEIATRDGWKVPSL